jgi:hypothetical protein
MELVYTPVALPGCCFICMAATRDSYIDTGVTRDYDGAYYICNLCCHEIAEKYGYLSMDEYKDLRKAKEDLERINYELIKRVGGLEESLHALANAGYRTNDDGTVVISGGYLPEVVESGAQKSFSREASVGVGEGEITEQSDDEGVGKLHSDESSSDNFALEF